MSFGFSFGSSPFLPLLPCTLLPNAGLPVCPATSPPPSSPRLLAMKFFISFGLSFWLFSLPFPSFSCFSHSRVRKTSSGYAVTVSFLAPPSCAWAAGGSGTTTPFGFPKKSPVYEFLIMSTVSKPAGINRLFGVRTLASGQALTSSGNILWNRYLCSVRVLTFSVAEVKTTPAPFRRHASRIFCCI